MSNNSPSLKNHSVFAVGQCPKTLPTTSFTDPYLTKLSNYFLQVALTYIVSLKISSPNWTIILALKTPTFLLQTYIEKIICLDVKPDWNLFKISIDESRNILLDINTWNKASKQTRADFIDHYDHGVFKRANLWTST